MKFSQLASKTSKSVAKEEISINAKLLSQAGFINRLTAGVYSYLPLGTRVLANIEAIVRDEMSHLGAGEVLLPALQPRENWEKTSRWDSVDVLFKLRGQGDREFALGATHEEVVAPLIGSYIQSYRDLPRAVFQIQTKFRNEARAKSGLLRGREFRMKDMYSFHASEEDLDSFYESVITRYHAIFKRCGIGESTVLTAASGSSFSKYSHEFQTITQYGEDTIYRTSKSATAINKEIIHDNAAVKDLWGSETGQHALEEAKAIEVGNIFKLGTRFTDAFEVYYAAANGEKRSIYMGCYGIGTSRLMGTIVETLHDDKGIIWPVEVSPFQLHLVSMHGEQSHLKAQELYRELIASKISVLWDDRTDVRAGQKFADADLIGIPLRLVVGEKGDRERFEVVERRSREVHLVEQTQIAEFVRKYR